MMNLPTYSKRKFFKFYILNIKSDFNELDSVLAGINGKFIMSNNDTPEIRSIFNGFKIEEVHQYSISGESKQVSELLITNFEAQ